MEGEGALYRIVSDSAADVLVKLMIRAGSALAVIGTSTKLYDHLARSLFLHWPFPHVPQSQFLILAQVVLQCMSYGWFNSSSDRRRPWPGAASVLKQDYTS